MGPRRGSGLDLTCPRPRPWRRSRRTATVPARDHRSPRDRPRQPGDAVRREGRWRAGRAHPEARTLRPPVSNERLELLPDGLVRVRLKKALADGRWRWTWTRCRWSHVGPPAAPAVPHRDLGGSAGRGQSLAGAGGAGSGGRGRESGPAEERDTAWPSGAYRSWAEMLERTFGVDVLRCPRCQGCLRLIAMLTEAASVARYLAAIGEPTELPRRAPHRGPPYWASTVLRQKARGAVGAGTVGAGTVGAGTVGAGTVGAGAGARHDAPDDERA